MSVLMGKTILILSVLKFKNVCLTAVRLGAFYERGIPVEFPENSITHPAPSLCRSTGAPRPEENAHPPRTPLGPP